MKSALILEDAAEVRAWLRELVTQAFPEATIQEAGSLAQALRTAENGRFDLALIDINLPDGTGLELLRALRAQQPQCFCVMATIFDDDENILRALQAGAQGYLLKDQPRERLLSALQGILAGEPPLSPHVARRILAHFRPANTATADNILSVREREILTLVAKGLNRNEIAAQLHISAHTVATHIRAIYTKLDISSRAEATVEAIRRGLLTP